MGKAAFYKAFAAVMVTHQLSQLKHEVSRNSLLILYTIYLLYFLWHSKILFTLNNKKA